MCSLFVSWSLSHTPLSAVDLFSVPLHLWFNRSGNLSEKGVMREDLLRIIFLLTTRYETLCVLQWMEAIRAFDSVPDHDWSQLSLLGWGQAIFQPHPFHQVYGFGLTPVKLYVVFCALDKKAMIMIQSQNVILYELTYSKTICVFAPPYPMAARAQFRSGQQDNIK